jgi:HlyD family secretion protein
MKLSPRMRRFVQIGIAVVALVVIVFAMLPDPVPADIVTVERGPLQVVVRHEGITRVRDRYMVSAPVRGKVLRIELEPGDPVRADETVVAALEPDDPMPLDARTRAESRAAVRAAEAELERASAVRLRAAEEKRFADNEVRRIRALAADGIVAESRLDQAETQARAAKEALDAALAAERRARFELERAQASLLPVTVKDDDGGRVELRAPIDGVVLRRLQESEAAVPQGAPLVEIADTSRLEIVADFLSTDAVLFEPGMPAIIDGWGGARSLAATVRRVEPAGFMKVSALGVEEQRVNVLLDFDDPREAWDALGDAYRVQVGVVVWQTDETLLVPASALFRDGEEWSVFRVDADDTARLTRVEIGRQSGIDAQVTSGLSEGDRVIVHPSDAVTDGTSVTAREGS